MSELFNLYVEAGSPNGDTQPESAIRWAADEIARLQSEVERLQGRCAELEEAIRSVVRAAPSSGPLWFQSKEINQLCNACEGSSDAWLLRKQAEAVEAAARECMPGPCGPPDDPPAGYQEYCEGVASVRDYAQRLRQQADEAEKEPQPEGAPS